MNTSENLDLLSPFKQWSKYFAIFQDFSKPLCKFNLPKYITEQAIDLAHQLDWFDDDAHYEFFLKTFQADAEYVDNYSDAQKGLIKKIIFFEIKPHWQKALKDPSLQVPKIKETSNLGHNDQTSTMEKNTKFQENFPTFYNEEELVDVNDAFDKFQSQTEFNNKPLKVYIAQFYYVRFFPDYVIPVSTVMWNPKWFNDFKGQDYVFIDKRNVVNGLKAKMFPLSQDHWQKLEEKDTQCRKDCPYKTQLPCEFMKVYSQYLHTLNFQDVMNQLKQLALKGQQLNHCQKDPAVCLLVSEAVSCPCAERPCIIQWFKENGIELEEITKENIDNI